MIVPANPGFVVLSEDSLTGQLICAEAVVAWNIEPRNGSFDVDPVTLEGNTESCYFGMLCPDGRVETPSMIFGNLSEAEAFSVKRKSK